MDRLTLCNIAEELDSSEVAALCFLCLDVVGRRDQEGIQDAKDLFLRLEEKGLLQDSVFLCDLLDTIRRMDLLRHLQTVRRQQEETDASPGLSNYRRMLYHMYEEINQEKFKKLKFLLGSNRLLSERQLEASQTALDVFSEMEKTGLLSRTKVDVLKTALQEIDRQLASIVQRYRDDVTRQHSSRSSAHVSIDYQGSINNSVATTPARDSQSSQGEGRVPFKPVQVPTALDNQADYYTLNHDPRGVCMIINNEDFSGTGLRRRGGTQEDEKALEEVFTQFGFEMMKRRNVTAQGMKAELQKLGKRNFFRDDALVVCVLSHGDIGCVFGADEQQVSIRELTQPFRSVQAPTLAGKPKLFFIQACQGGGYQGGSMPCYPQPVEEKEVKQRHLEEDAGPVQGETIPSDADFLLGMATVPECKSFRNTSTGSIYIQELCKQLRIAAESSGDDDILTVLTRVNREVSKGEYLSHKQMPEPKYTLTKKLVLKYVKTK